jgi:hypothetical protein
MLWWWCVLGFPRGCSSKSWGEEESMVGECLVGRALDVRSDEGIAGRGDEGRGILYVNLFFACGVEPAASWLVTPHPDSEGPPGDPFLCRSWPHSYPFRFGSVLWIPSQSFVPVRSFRFRPTL